MYINIELDYKTWRNRCVSEDVRRTDEIARRNDERSKSHSKEYEDRKINERERHINIGDKVLLQNETPSKCTMKFKPILYTVKDTKGPMVSVESDSDIPELPEWTVR